MANFEHFFEHLQRNPCKTLSPPLLWCSVFFDLNAGMHFSGGR